MSRIEQQRRCFISFIPDNSHYILIKSKKKEGKGYGNKKNANFAESCKRFMYQTIIIQCSKPSFPSLENGFDGVRENISFPVSFCVSNLVSSNNLLTHTHTHRRYWRNFSLKPLSVRAREIWRIPLRQRTYMWFLRLNFCVLLRRLVV